MCVSGTDSPINRHVLCAKELQIPIRSTLNKCSGDGNERKRKEGVVLNKNKKDFKPTVHFSKLSPL